MKDIYENSENFTAFATIQACYFELKQICNDDGNTPIDILVDKATGYDAAQIKAAIDVVDEIIKQKQFLEAEAETEKKLLEKLERLACKSKK